MAQNDYVVNVVSAYGNDKCGDIIRILVDGDSCPVIRITEKVVSAYKLELIVFVDYAHQIELDYGKVVKVDTENQSVDMEIVNRCKNNDIVITQDYGLAALVLGKGAYPLNFNGKNYTEDNIDRLLMIRHQNAKLRRRGKKHPTYGKRREEDDIRFEKSLIKLINLINLDE